MGEPSIARCLFGLDPRSDRLQINSCSAVLRLMRSAIYLNNSIEGHEKLHENEEAAKLVVGNTIEREGEYWNFKGRCADRGVRVATARYASGLPQSGPELNSRFPWFHPNGSLFLSLDHISSHVSSNGQIAKTFTTNRVPQIKPRVFRILRHGNSTYGLGKSIGRERCAWRARSPDVR
jgi:hypothetical protein